ncbi:hypothetical protein PYW08_000470 [Mythimna loreyi]|uniref:Uncharacterized protein n=1 Tax=Mythimna loreyi TaxID=667449 RepID=A0ACC2RCM0_9NEOP|nr:hypothetical protein PYW08_000470 [Mythimna loreyi]
MVTMKHNHKPFNSTQKRFGPFTGHPNLDPSGLFVTDRAPGCDPCLYRPKSVRRICEAIHSKNIDKDPWKYKNDLEEWSKNLGYRNQKILENRRWQKALLGPAWHEIRDIPAYQAACMNVGFGRTALFKPSKQRAPDPGTYYKAVPFKAPYGPHSVRPSFDREEPCRFKDPPSSKWSLAPNRYSILDKEQIDQKSKKLVSIRGPYDLFTGKRDESTIKNHFSTSLKCTAATWPIALKGSLEKYKTSHFGVLNKTNRNKPYRGRMALVDLSMCPRKPKDPGPGHYDVGKAKPFVQYKYGFNSSYDKPPGYRRVIVWPGVGRYKVTTGRPESCPGIPGSGHKHVFLSKIQRTIGAIIMPPMNSF